jgi:FAD:protein FMN transferase
VLGCGPGPEGKGWPIRTGLAEGLVHLRDEALSGSGTEVKGAHIMDPRTLRPASLRRRDHVWVRTPVAAVSDAFSTAFLVLSPEEVAAVCARHPEIQLVRAEKRSARR